jgi:hypothetical protein
MGVALSSIRSPVRSHPNPQQFPQHAQAIAEHRHLRLAAIVPLNRHLDDAESLLAGNGQDLAVNILNPHCESSMPGSASRCTTPLNRRPIR